MELPPSGQQEEPKVLNTARSEGVHHDFPICVGHPTSMFTLLHVPLIDHPGNAPVYVPLSWR